MGDSDGPSAAFMSALVTEHFAQQSTASTTVSEATGRCSLYLAALSSGMIAIGFASQAPQLQLPLVAAVLPTVFVLGVFTVIRLVGTGVQNVVSLAAIARIRDYYRTIDPAQAALFGRLAGSEPVHVDEHTAEALGSLAVTPGFSAGLFTTASMIATLNAVVCGMGIGLVVPGVLAAPAGVLAGIAWLVWFHRYQYVRYTTASRPAA